MARSPLEEKRVRARDLDLPLGRFKPGRFNAITDVEGVLVGHSTIIEGDGKLKVGHGPVRTGVTAILPNEANIFMERLAGGAFVLNGAGEVSGLTQLVEWGLLETPILLTNTMSVGAVSDAVARYMVQKHPGIGEEHDVIIPVVGECDDSWLNDISGNHVKEKHVREAIESAKSGMVPEGAVGGGTGMITCDFKAGIGTSSRKLPEVFGGYTLGVLVMSNFGKMHNLRVAGMPVGELLAEKLRGLPRREHSYGSIIAVVATDAPLLPHQLSRLCKRVALGIGRVGSYAAHGSGEIVVGFSTANVIPAAHPQDGLQDEAAARSAPRPPLRGGDGGDRRGDPQLHVHGDLDDGRERQPRARAAVGRGAPLHRRDPAHLRFREEATPDAEAVPASKEKPSDIEKEGSLKVADASPTAVRSAEGIPYPTRGGPEGS